MGMSKRILTAVKVFFVVAFLSFSVLASGQDAVVMNGERDFSNWVSGLKLEARGDVHNPVLNEPKLTYPVKMRIAVVPQLIRASFSSQVSFQSHRERYTVILFGFGTNIPFKGSELEGQINPLFFLELETSLLKPEHFDMLLESSRKFVPADIQGYVDSQNRLQLAKSKDYPNSFEVRILLHPTSINGKPLP